MALAVSCSIAHGAPVLVNGSLTGSIANAGVPTGWSVTSPSPDTMDQDNNVGGPFGGFGATPTASPDGGTWVGFARDGSFIESFGQVVAGFDVGSSYDLSWYHANFGYTPGGYTGDNAVEVLLDGIVMGSGALRSLSEGWVDETISFVATAASHRIDFRLRETARSYHSIDGIRLSDSTGTVPEPLSLGLVAVGLLGVAASRRGSRAAR
ncbi:MAG: PEP-CTERM sorting domain-containing protein [Rubrivivax sp.]|nr:PEP-CTERM sorting domain-containing protein [Rubrivivax sp.]